MYGSEQYDGNKVTLLIQPRKQQSSNVLHDSYQSNV